MTNNNFQFVLFDSTSTQRVVVRYEDSSTVLVTKEWRKNGQEDWRIGKGISFPRHKLVELGKICGAQTQEELENLLSAYELVQEDKNDNAEERIWNNKSAYNRNH